MTEANDAVLYGYFRSTAAYRVRIALGLKACARRTGSYTCARASRREEAYRRINPAGLVPNWIQGGLHLAQSLAIIEYLDETHPCRRCCQRTFRPAPLFAKWPRWCAATSTRSAIWGADRLTELGVDDAARAKWSQHWIETGFDAIEARLAQLPGPFAFGVAPTLADICIVPQVFNARRFNVDLAPYPRSARSMPPRRGSSVCCRRTRPAARCG